MREIRVEHLTKRYGRENALDDVSLSFEHGKLHGLLGRNGAGKSTLLGVVSNRLLPTDGRVLIDGEPARDNSRAQAKVHCTTELGMNLRNMSMVDLIKALETSRNDFDAAKARRLVEVFSLDAKKLPYKLSTGYRTIYQLVVALSLDVDYLLLDEPVLGLDAGHRDLVYKLLLEDYTERERTVIIATHLIEEVANLVERVAVIDSGKLLLESSTDDLRSSAYSVSGLATDVDAYCSGERVVGCDEAGDVKVAYLMGEVRRERLHDRLTVAPVGLQKLFVKLTEGEKRA